MGSALRAHCMPAVGPSVFMTALSALTPVSGAGSGALGAGTLLGALGSRRWRHRSRRRSRTCSGRLERHALTSTHLNTSWMPVSANQLQLEGPMRGSVTHSRRLASHVRHMLTQASTGSAGVDEMPEEAGVSWNDAGRGFRDEDGGSPAGGMK